MGCLYDSWANGCEMADEPDTDCGFQDCWEGCDMYESDYTCTWCGADFNLDEECTCEDV